MYKKLLAAIALLASCGFGAQAQIVESTSSSVTIFEEHKPPKERPITDRFYTLGFNGGISTTYRWGACPSFWLNAGYKRQINATPFYWGGQIDAGSGIWSESSYFFDVAPTISYVNKPGGFYNTFEATFGLGFGARHAYATAFAFVPELNLSYWFNRFGVGLTARYSISKALDETSICGVYYRDGLPYTATNTFHNDRSDFFVAARLAVRF